LVIKRMSRLVALLLLLITTATIVTAQKGDFLTDEEEDKLRETQDPSARIETYLDFAQARLERIDEFRQRPADPKYDNGAYLDGLVGQYIALTDELKKWIQDQYDRQGDMRRGLKKLLESGPKQLEELRRIQQSPDRYFNDYAKSLRDAIDDLNDAIDGATKALADQIKKFGEMKREAKAEAQATKLREKEEKKQTKEEKKLRKRKPKRGVPADTDQD
jgi:peptidoglycan hydrolase CwlO-like protein